MCAGKFRLCNADEMQHSYQQHAMSIPLMRLADVYLMYAEALYYADGDETNARQWMNKVLQRYSDHVAILLFHGYIAEDGRYTVVGKNMFENVVKPNPNVRLVLCGHVCGTGHRAEDIDDTGDGVPDGSVENFV